MRKLTFVAAMVLATGLIAAGCGDDDDDGGDALTQAEFVTQANEICEQGNAELDAAAEAEFGDSQPSEADFEAFVTDEFVPNVQGQVEDIRSLNAPESDVEAFDAIAEEVETTLDELAEDPALLQQGDPFADVNGQLRDLGLATCAG